MARRLRRLSARDVLRILKGFGFEVVATRGSHAKVRRVTDDGRRETLTLPLHKELDVGTLQAIFRQAARFVREDELKERFYRD